jgi:hypothetical protein
LVLIDAGLAAAAMSVMVVCSLLCALCAAALAL